jgi:hypothetical protein
MPTLEREPKLQTQTASPPAPPNGRGPPKIVAMGFPDRKTCLTHPRRELSDAEVAKNYTRCADCRQNEKALKTIRTPANKVKKIDRKKDKNGATAKQKTKMEKAIGMLGGQTWCDG